MDDNIRFRYYWFLINHGENNDVLDWQTRYNELLNSCHQDIDDNHVDTNKFHKLIFEEKFAFETYEEASIISIKKGIEIIKNNICPECKHSIIAKNIKNTQAKCIYCGYEWSV